MREFIKHIYLHYPISQKIIGTIIKLRTKVLTDKYLLKTRFKRRLGYSLNIKNPSTLNEKIQWLKLHDRSDLHPICADKFRVRKYVSDKIGDKYLIPLILNTDKPMEINPDVLPDYPFIIKTNHDSSGGIFVWDKGKIDWDAEKKKLKKRLNSDFGIFGKGEWQYDLIKPQIIIEKLLIVNKSEIPEDYKMHFFNGKLNFTQVDMDRETNHRRNLYDPDWKLMPVRWSHKNGRHIDKPKVFNEMIEVGESLSKDFTYVRVDLYVVDDKIFFGELTFHPASGNEGFYPKEWDKKFGEMLKLPLTKK